MMENSTINIDAIFTAYEDQEPVEVKVLEATGKGFYVDLFGMRCFLPGSETADKENVKEGDTLEVAVMKMNAARPNVVVSNRVIVERRAEMLAQKTLSELQIGSVVPGVVVNIATYGAFVSVGGIAGLVHINELSWQKITDVNEVLKVGDTVNVKVIGIEEKKGTTRLSLSIKQCEPDPWSLIREKDYLGHIIEGTVTQVVNYGAFVNIGPIEGLVHTSEMSWSNRKIKPADIVAVGDKVIVKVTELDAPGHKLALSMKDAMQDPWDSISEDMIGMDFEATVTHTVNFGIYAEILPNVEGLVHVSELSWAKIIDATEYSSVGDKIRVRLLSYDKFKRKMELSHKVLVENPWDNMDPDKYLGNEYEGVVTAIKKKYISVRFAPELVGILADNDMPAKPCKVGDVLRVTPNFMDVRKKAVYLKTI